MVKFIAAFCLFCLMTNCAPTQMSDISVKDESFKKKAASYLIQEYYLIILVDARHLNYENSLKFFKTLTKHPSDCSKNGDVGHAWIYLHGFDGQKEWCLEGGHSGERGLLQPKYFDGVMNYIEFGQLYPDEKKILNQQDEPNPIKYLWEDQQDGFFQYGAGGHCPTYAVKIALAKEEFLLMQELINTYDFSRYSLIDSQCVSFVKQLAAIAGVELESQVTISMESSILLQGQKLDFWQDPCYSKITIHSPDVLEKSLMKAVVEGKAQAVLREYRQRHPLPLKLRLEKLKELFILFPDRLRRHQRI